MLQNTSVSGMPIPESMAFLSVKIEKAKDVAYKTTIKGREWANTIPVRGICPPSHSGFELPTFFISGRSIKKL